MTQFCAPFKYLPPKAAAGVLKRRQKPRLVITFTALRKAQSSGG